MVLEPNQEGRLPQLESSRPPKGRLTFIIYKMSEGGAQRQLSILVNFLSDQGWSITVLTFDDGSSPSFYKLRLSVQLIPLSIMRHQKGFLRSLTIPFLRPWILRKAFPVWNSFFQFFQNFFNIFMDGLAVFQGRESNQVSRVVCKH